MSLVAPQWAFAQHAPPRMVFHARFWDTMPGWQPETGDYAYIEFTPTGDHAADAQAIQTELGTAPPGQRLLGTNSIQHIDEILKVLDAADFAVNCLGYDLEFRPQTPEAEQADPVAATRSGYALAQARNIPFLLVPTAQIAERWGAQLAPHSDWFQPQGKAYQAYEVDLAVYRQRKVYHLLREANPEIKIWHDMAIMPKGKALPLEELLDYYYGCSDMAVGLSIWATPAHREMLTRFVLTVRPPASPPEGVTPPRITAPASVNRAQGLVGERLSFSVAAEHEDAEALTYTWDFGDHKRWGDGNVLVRGREVVHHYREPGEYTAAVSVTDGRSGVARSEVALTITIDPSGPGTRPARP